MFPPDMGVAFLYKIDVGAILSVVETLLLG